jgi:hypothetical protein
MEVFWMLRIGRSTTGECGSMMREGVDEEIPDAE